MTLAERYDHALQGPWKTSGLDVQYKIDSTGTLTFQYTVRITSTSAPRRTFGSVSR